jgi:hypothetical protein
MVKAVLTNANRNENKNKVENKRYVQQQQQQQQQQQYCQRNRQPSLGRFCGNRPQPRFTHCQALSRA